MAIGSNYFSHDYNARTDDKIKKLIRKHGMEGYGIYWSIVEDLYQNANAMQLDCNGIAYDLRCDEKTVESIIHEFELFSVTEGVLCSNSIQKRMEFRDEKSKKLSENARKRWEQKQLQSKGNAIALQPESKSNAIKRNKRKVKEKKGNESKGKEESGAVAPTPEQILEVRKKEFYATLVPFLKQYGKEMLRDFYEYWTEPNKSKSLFKQEMQKTWDLSMRLNTWAKRDTSFVKQNPVIPIDPLSSRLAKDEKIRKEVYGD